MTHGSPPDEVEAQEQVDPRPESLLAKQYESSAPFWPAR
jgi:hypothetical protein